MNLTTRITALFLLSVAPVHATTRLVAMRVEVEPRSAGDTGTTVALVVQIAPEDRQLIGREAWVRARLQQEQETVDRVDSVVEVSPDGVAQIELTWPPGEYTLRVDIESRTGTEGGFWEGSVTVPRLEREVPPPPAVAAAPATAADPSTQPAADAPPESGPEPEVTLATAAATAVPEPGAAAAAASSPPSSPDPVPVAATSPPVVAQTSAVTADRETSQPDAPGTDQDTSARGLTTLTVLVTEGDRSAARLQTDDLRLVVNRTKVAIEQINAAPETPLRLGFAVQLSSRMEDDAARVSRLLGPLLVIPGHGRGESFLVTADADLDLSWGANPAQLAEAIESATTGPDDVARLVRSALQRFSTGRGRDVLVVITDGHDTATRSDWAGTVTEAEAAGVPVFVICFWDSQFSERARQQLRTIANASGGRITCIPGLEIMPEVVEDYVAAVQSSQALRFRLPSNSKDGFYRIKVEPTRRGLDVRHPTTIRDAGTSSR